MNYAHKSITHSLSGVAEAIVSLPLFCGADIVQCIFNLL